MFNIIWWEGIIWKIFKRDYIQRVYKSLLIVDPVKGISIEKI